MANWQDEFPDFPADTMPDIPTGWTDRSWHNDACPSFLTADGRFVVWIDFADPALREAYRKGEERFFVYATIGDDDMASEATLTTNDWAAVLAAVA